MDLYSDSLRKSFILFKIDKVFKTSLVYSADIQTGSDDRKLKLEIIIIIKQIFC